MLIKIARIHKEQGKPKEALDSYKIAAHIFETLDALKFLVMALNEMGVLYANLGKAEESIKILEKLMQIYESKNMNREKIDVFRDLGIVYSRMGHFNEALEYFELALNLIKEIGLEESEKAIFIKNQIEATKNSIRIKKISERF
jgi:tetratricopeptide (TPR) repeat protein